MMSLFSVFDPISYCGFMFNWMVMIIVMVFLPIKYYLMCGNYYSLKTYFLKYVQKAFQEVAFPNYMAITYMSVVVFLYLVISNLMGLFPFVFTSTAHPLITMGWGFVLWLSFFSMGWIKNFTSSAAHLVPKGSPLSLAPLLVLIESISHLIRPFTLSIRLAANMMAGHLILGLISMMSLINFSSFLVSLSFQSMLLILEFAVAVIQGFVFSILLLLYSLDYY